MFWDLLLMLNFVLNYYLLYYAGRLGGNGTPPKMRIAIGALLGAAASLAVFFPAMDWVFSLQIKLLLAAIMVLVSFYPFSFVQGLKYWVYLHLVTFAVGGLVFALSLLGIPVSWNQGLIITAPSPLLLGIGMVLGIVVVRGLENHRSYKEWVNGFKGRLMFELCKQKVEITAVVDTGNVVREPITGMPVIIVPPGLLKEIIPENILNSCPGTEKFIEIISSYPDLMHLLHVVPFQALGAGQGILAGFRVTGAKFFSGSKIYLLCPLILAVADNSWKNEKHALLPGAAVLSSQKSVIA